MLRDVVGTANVMTDPEVTAAYARDWTGRFRGATSAVVRPGSVEEVAGVLAACDDAGVAVVPQGGNTGLVGGSVPLHHEIVVSLLRLRELSPVDARSGQVTAQAGVTIGALQTHARASGWDYAVDLGARDSATVGGTIATNAGGVHVIRHGSTRRQLLGYEAVLADGRVLRHLDGLEKDNTGYDLASLICGSEGTLAVVTAARLRLVAHPEHVVVALLAFDAVEDALDAVGALRRSVDVLDAVELFFAPGLRLVCSTFSLREPFPEPHAAFVLVEAAGSTDPTETLAAGVQALARVADVAVAAEPERRAELWRYREAHTEAINTLGAPLKLDVTLPPDELAPFVERVGATVTAVAPGAHVWLFGHAGDGNVHVNVTGVDANDDRVTDVVLRLVAQLRGSISAEHGIGTAKRAWVHLNRSPEEISTFRAIKQALDPRGILNPNVLLPLRSEARA
ncbi:MAG: FAD-binding oxidoreductase [Actinomycetia bacterium]|nr:FAD-binding oxidoreductase [Actinomycetes bacterium]